MGNEREKTQSVGKRHDPGTKDCQKRQAQTVGVTCHADGASVVDAFNLLI